MRASGIRPLSSPPKKGFLITRLPMRTFVCRYGLDVNGTPRFAGGGTKCFDQDRALYRGFGICRKREMIKDAVPERLVTAYKYCATEELQLTLCVCFAEDWLRRTWRIAMSKSLSYQIRSTSQRDSQHWGLIKLSVAVLLLSLSLPCFLIGQEGNDRDSFHDVKPRRSWGSMPTRSFAAD